MRNFWFAFWWLIAIIIVLIVATSVYVTLNMSR